MKTNWMLTGIAVAGAAFASIANSQKPAVDPFAVPAEGAISDASVVVQVQVEIVEMSHEALTKLLFLAKPATPDATKLRQEVQDMVAKNEAKVLETQLVVTRSGQKGTAESIQEFIYPSEYEPPELPSSPGDTKNQQSKLGGVFPFNPATPTAFDTRNVGSTLEVEPTVSQDNRIVEVRVVPELIWHTGNTTWHEGKDQAGNPFKVQMPDFNTLRLNTSVTCISGQYTLAGVLSPKNDKGEVDMTRKLMIFVKCDALVVK